jgi:hypothetical protein
MLGMCSNVCSTARNASNACGKCVCEVCQKMSAGSAYIVLVMRVMLETRGGRHTLAGN